jgi:uncharacterized protein (DUF4415 family)
MSSPTIGRPALPPERRKQMVSVRIAPEIIAFYKTPGRGWNARMEAALRAGMKTKASASLAVRKRP